MQQYERVEAVELCKRALISQVVVCLDFIPDMKLSEFKKCIQDVTKFNLETINEQLKLMECE